jgi:hypothetical protein
MERVRFRNAVAQREKFRKFENAIYELKEKSFIKSCKRTKGLNAAVKKSKTNLSEKPREKLSNTQIILTRLK